MDTPNISDKEVQEFCFAVGQAIQNYGTIEYLVNGLIAILVSDSVIASHLVKQNVSKRLDVLESLVNRKSADLREKGFSIDGLFVSAKAAFHDRNKIAHNPFVVSVAQATESSKPYAGIHVLRYHEEGRTEEWIDKAKLESMKITARVLLKRFNTLLGLCSKN